MPADAIVICTDISKKFYQSLFKAQKLNPQIFTTEDSLIAYIDQVEELLEIPFCVIHLRLKWNSQSFFSLRLAERLRVGGLRCPFYFFSYFPRMAFDFRLPEYALLRVKNYHQLITMPVPERFWEGLPQPPMLEYKRQDIVRNLLSNDHLLSEVLHELKNKILVASEQRDIHLIKNIIAAKFSELSVMFSDQAALIKEIEIKLNDAIEEFLTPEKSGQIPNIIDSFKPAIIRFLPSKEKENKPNEVEQKKTKWKVLFFDDEQKFHIIFHQFFEDQGIPCIVSNSGEEVIQQLKADQVHNLITVLICDIRILEADGIEWKAYQGYDVMWEVREQLSNLLELVALTSGRSHLLELLEDDQIKFHRMLKQDVLSSDGAKRMFVDRIRELGDQLFFKSRSKPKQASWTTGNPKRFPKPLAHYYREHLFALDYESAEEILSKQALEYLDLFKRGKERPVIEFTGTMLSDPPKTPDGLKKFRDRILLGRRIALALYLDGEKTDSEVYGIMMSQPGDDFPDTTINQLLVTTLALSFKKDLPSEKDIQQQQYLGSGLLEEEIKWLVKNFKIPFGIKQFRISEKEKTAVVLLLSGLVYSLKKKISPIPPSDKKLTRFLQFNFEKIKNVKTAKDWFKEAFALAREYNLTTEFCKNIQDELEDGFIQQNDLKVFLKEQLEA